MKTEADSSCRILEDSAVRVEPVGLILHRNAGERSVTPVMLGNSHIRHIYIMSYLCRHRSNNSINTSDIKRALPAVFQLWDIKFPNIYCQFEPEPLMENE